MFNKFLHNLTKTAIEATEPLNSLQYQRLTQLRIPENDLIIDKSQTYIIMSMSIVL